MQILKSAHNKKYNYVFFDIFDTIVERTVNPEYTKKIWANYMVKRLDMQISMTELYSIRNKIEYELGQENASKGYDWEFTYSSLIEKIYKKLQNINCTYEKFYEIAEDIEVEIEKNVQKIDKDIIDEIKKLKKEGKKIYCISDMYLSKNMIQKIFEKHNILDLFEDIYISCEYLKNKKTGNLYELLLEEQQISPQECIMIGDNKSSDYDIPKSKGISAIHLDRTKNYERYANYDEQFNENSVKAKFLEISKTTTDNFEHAIFTLYSFIEKLYFELLKEDKDEVFFLSREGEYLKKLFDEFVKVVNYKKIKSHYLLVSRKATFLPSLNELEKEDFGRLLKQYSYISINDFMKSLNFNDKDITKIQSSVKKDYESYKGKLNDNQKKELQELINGNYDVKLTYTFKSPFIKVLRQNQQFKEVYEKNRKEQKELFKQYISEKTTSKELCVVDIGWNGSIQDNIQYILGNDYKVTGCLYGLVSREPENFKYDKKGLIFSNVPNVTKNYNLFVQNRSIFEILLGASHGSANRYELKNGKVNVLLFNKQEERDLFDNVISKIQDNMFELYKEILNILPNGYYDDKKMNREINKIHFKMVFEPTKEQLRFFNKINHYENFGVFEFSEFSLNKKLSLKYYIKENIKFFVKYKSFFYDTFWPVHKLSNEKLYLQKFIYVNIEKIKLIMGRLI